MGRQPPAAVCKQKLRKGLWSPEEDEKLVNHISAHGVGCWSSVPKQAGLQRCGKSCRLRWINYLRPDIKRGRFSTEEEGTIIRLHRVLGNRWSRIAARLPGRTDNEIKNFWNTNLKKKLGKQGGVDLRDTYGPYKEDNIPANNDDRRRRPVFYPFPAAAADDLDYPFLTYYHHMVLQQHGPPHQELISKAVDGHHHYHSTAMASSGPSSYGSVAEVTADSSNHSCSNSNSNAMGVGGLDWYVERSIDDFFHLTPTDCLGLQDDQQGLEISTLMDMSGAGGELDCESQVGFL